MIPWNVGKEVIFAIARRSKGSRQRSTRDGSTTKATSRLRLLPSSVTTQEHQQPQPQQLRLSSLLWLDVFPMRSPICSPHVLNWFSYSSHRWLLERGQIHHFECGRVLATQDSIVAVTNMSTTRGCFFLVTNYFVSCQRVAYLSKKWVTCPHLSWWGCFCLGKSLLGSEFQLGINLSIVGLAASVSFSQPCNVHSSHRLVWVMLFWHLHTIYMLC